MSARPIGREQQLKFKHQRGAASRRLVHFYHPDRRSYYESIQYIVRTHYHRDPMISS